MLDNKIIFLLESNVISHRTSFPITLSTIVLAALTECDHPLQSVTPTNQSGVAVQTPDFFTPIESFDDIAAVMNDSSLSENTGQSYAGDTPHRTPLLRRAVQCPNFTVDSNNNAKAKKTGKVSVWFKIVALLVSFCFYYEFSLFRWIPVNFEFKSQFEYV